MVWLKVDNVQRFSLYLFHCFSFFLLFVRIQLRLELENFTFLGGCEVLRVRHFDTQMQNEPNFKILFTFQVRQIPSHRKTM